MEINKYILRKVIPILFILSCLAMASNAFAATRQVLILHDSSGPTGHVGKEFAIMLENLLGHFDADVTVMPVSSYTGGLIDSQDATFYIGSTFDEAGFFEDGSSEQQSYSSFIQEAASTPKTLVWLNYNLAKIAQEWNTAWGAESFSEKTGYKYIGALNRSFNRVKYKNVELNKGVVWANPGANLDGCIKESETLHACATELNTIEITDTSKAKVFATALTTIEQGIGEHAYITRSGNFWFVGDIPMLHFSEEDRYLAFADVLHDMLNTGVTEQPPTALLRLEDVSAGSNPVLLKTVLEYLDAEKIPFSVALIPVYDDPNGKNTKLTGGIQHIELPQSEVANILQPYYQKNLASIITHGYTHQYSNLDNPFDGVSGRDYEFYRVTIDPADNSLKFTGPVPEDSAEWANDRMTQAGNTMNRANFKSFAWEAPHYLASKTDFLEIKKLFPVHYGRMGYFTEEGPNARVINQLFPYVIERDAYGYFQLPENIGNIQKTALPGFRLLLPEDLIRHAEKMKVVRDGVASFYYHPFIGTEDLKKTIDGIKALGYTFKAPCSLSPSGCPDPSTATEASSSTNGSEETNSGISSNNKADDGGGSTGFFWLLFIASIRMVRYSQRPNA